MLWVEHALAEGAGDAVLHVAAVGVPAGGRAHGRSRTMAIAMPGREAVARGSAFAAAIDKLARLRRPSWLHLVAD